MHSITATGRRVMSQKMDTLHRNFHGSKITDIFPTISSPLLFGSTIFVLLDLIDIPYRASHFISTPGELRELELIYFPCKARYGQMRWFTSRLSEFARWWLKWQHVGADGGCGGGDGAQSFFGADDGDSFVPKPPFGGMTGLVVLLYQMGQG